jgi:hypothetical protein
MKIFELLKNPLLKFPLIAVILYFGLFHDKKNPESLGNRLSTANIKKNFNEAREKTKFIAVNVQQAQEFKKKQIEGAIIADKVKKEEVALLIDDAEIGIGPETLACDDVAQISYAIYNKIGKQLVFIATEKLAIGKKVNPLIDKNIIGMKKGGIRNIKVPHDFKTTDQKLLQLLKFNEGNLKYQVTLLDFTKSLDPHAVCD